MSANRILELAENEKDLRKIELMVPTDIFYIKEIVKTIPHVPQSRNHVLLVWIYVLLKNPFDVSDFVTPGELEDLKGFLLDSLKTSVDRQLKKSAIKAIALLVNSVVRENEHELYSTLANGFTLCGRKVSETEFYSFLKQLSKVRSVSREYVKFLDSDSITIKRYKIKILSHSLTFSVSDLKELMSFINVNDSKLGWTLSKSIYRVSKHLDRHGLVEDLKLLVSKPIFGDEQLWANVMSILGFFAFDGYDIGDVCLVSRAFLYDNEFVAKSANVREAALFLHWCLLRSSFPIGGAIHTIIFVSLFDRELICRRAAASVVQEYIGRAMENEDVDGVIQIDPGSVKRPENCLRMFCAIRQKNSYKHMVFDMLYSFNRLNRAQAAEIIARFYSPFEVEIRYKTVNEMDGVHLLVLKAHMLRQSGREPGMVLEDALRKQFKSIVSGFTLTPRMYKLRNIQEAIESYLKLHEIVDPKPFKENIMFLIAKNFAPELILDAVGPVMQDQGLSKAVFSTISKNPSGILANSRNHLLRDQCIRRFVSNLENKVYINYTIRALYEMEAYTEDVSGVVRGFLDDYTIDMCGDSGYFNRREAFFYFLKLRSKDRSCSNVPIEHFVVRFMADKSKRLREDILRSLLSDSYARFKLDFSYMLKALEGGHCPTALVLDRDCSTKIEKFFSIHAEFSKECGNEEAYFKALFASFSDDEHFYHGIINTFNASDRRLEGILMELINPLRDRFVSTALDLIRKGQLFVYQSIKILLALTNEEFVVSEIGTIPKQRLDARARDLLDKITRKTLE